MSSFSDDRPQGETGAESLVAQDSANRLPPAPAPEPVSPHLEPTTVEFGPPQIVAAAPEPLQQDGHPEAALDAPAEVEASPAEPGTPVLTLAETPSSGTPLILGPMLPEVPRPVRIPHFGHLLILLLILAFGFAAAIGIVALAVHDHLYGVTSLQGTATEIHYTLGSEALIYIFTLVGCFLIFPLFWNKSVFSGLQWNAGTALRLRWRLVAAAFVCFLLALINSVVLPGPKNTPIEEVFKEPGAAWLLFVFGITFAPFFEEMFFRGFLLPALATACDWVAELFTGAPPRPLAERGHPRWSMTAMVIGSILTSIPFAALHAAQTGYSLGPFLLLVGVSLVLCTVRLWTRSLAASTLVHASYNFMLFAIMLVGTEGFRHMDKL